MRQGAWGLSLGVCRWGKVRGCAAPCPSGMARSSGKKETTLLCAWEGYVIPGKGTEEGMAGLFWTPAGPTPMPTPTPLQADLSAVLKLVGGSRGTPADRLRLAILWLLAYEGGCAAWGGATAATGGCPWAIHRAAEGLPPGWGYGERIVSELSVDGSHSFAPPHTLRHESW